jgi:hypothetical protein
MSDINSIENFALESYKVSKRNRKINREQESVSSSVDLRDFPNADFYFKLVAKVGGKFYSIFDGETEY